MRTLLGLTLTLVALAPLTAADWPGFRGPEHTGVSKEKGLLAEWPREGPTLAWKTDKVGLGYSGMAVVKGVVYTMGALPEEGKKKEAKKDKDRGKDDEEPKETDEYAIALDGKGKVKWATRVGPIHDWDANAFSRGPNATPTVDGDLVYCLSSGGVLMCLDTAGKPKWKKDLVKDLGGDVNKIQSGTKLGWGYSWSPVVDGDQLIITPGGAKGLVAALDRKTGDLKWRSAEVKESATYGTGTLATIAGVKQFVYVHQKGVVGVSTKDGALLWKYELKENFPDIVCASPVVAGDLVYVSVGYNFGSLGLKVTKNGDKLDAKVIYSGDDPKTPQFKTIGNRFTNVILLGKHVYGYHEERSWACQEVATGEVAWPKKAGRQRLKGGGMVAAEGRLYVLDDQGTVAMLEASPKQYKVLSSFKLPETSQKRKSRGGIWTYPTLSDGKLYLRDQELLFCFQVK